jgi:hypothetical protein
MPFAFVAVMEQSLGVLENIGKKTMRVITDKDPDALLAEKKAAREGTARSAVGPLTARYRGNPARRQDGPRLRCDIVA